MLFRKGDIGDLVTKTLSLAAAPQLRDEIGAKARQFAETRRFCHLLDAYEAAFDSVCREIRGN